MSNTPIVLHANRIKGLLIVSVIQFLFVGLAFAIIEMTNLYVPFVLAGCVGLGMVSAYRFAFQKSHLFIKEIIICENLENCKSDTNNEFINKVTLAVDNIKSYNIIKGRQLRFGYCLRIWNGKHNFIYFIVPKINSNILSKNDGFEKISIGEFYQKKNIFKDDFYNVSKFLNTNSIHKKRPQDFQLKILYVLPIILGIIMLVFCIVFPIYIIQSVIG